MEEEGLWATGDRHGNTAGSSQAGINEAADPYAGVERRVRAPLLQGAAALIEPLLDLLGRLGVSPNAVSAFQVFLTVGVFYTLPRWPHGSLALWLAAVVSDGIDGMLARRLDRASAFGLLWDQVCDHTREALVVGALAHYGLVWPLWAVLYAFAYPALNLALYLCNRHRVPLGLAVKPYVALYPALLAYLAWGVNLLTPALALATTAMVAGCAVAFRRLYWVLQAGQSL